MFAIVFPETRVDCRIKNGSKNFIFVQKLRILSLGRKINISYEKKYMQMKYFQRLKER